MNETLAKYKHEVSRQIINAVTQNEAPWQKPLLGGLAARNAITGRRYQGINQIILRLKDENSDPRWLTFKQAIDNDYRVKKGSKGVRITFWKPLIDLEAKEQIGQVQRVITVFNASQVEGINKFKPVTSNFELPCIKSYTESMKKLVSLMRYPEAMKRLINEIGRMFIHCELGLDYQPSRASGIQDSLQVLKMSDNAIFKAAAEAYRTIKKILSRKEAQ